MIKELKIEKFRNIENETFEFGKYLNLIAGQNGIGKSYLLALIGNLIEYKVKDGKPIIKNQFRCEFKEIIKLSKKYDLDKSREEKWKYTGIFSNNDVEESRYVLLYFNNTNGVQRIRMTPRGKNNNGTNTSSKIKYPVLYLGLSRLYPIGEAQGNIVEKNIKLNPSEEGWFIKNYNELLNLGENTFHENLKEISYNNSLKTSFGYDNGLYDHFGYSSGQDNISQILMSILSFRRLKNTNPEYKGGILLIDEIDCTLHASALNKLFKILYASAKELDLQIIMTTHSLFLIELFMKKYQKSHNDNIINNLIYLKKTSENKTIKIKKITYEKIEHILKNEILNNSFAGFKKIKIFTEDNEARWFLKYILDYYFSNYTKTIDFLDMSLGCKTLIDIRKKINEIFESGIIVLDGDAKNSISLDAEKIFNEYSDILFLPSDNFKNPECTLYDYLNSLDPEHEVFTVSNEIPDLHYDNEIFKEYSFDYFDDPSKSNKDRDKQKRWFKYFENIFDKIGLMNFWIKDNQDIIKPFVDSFEKEINSKSEILSLPKLIKKNSN